MTNPAQWGLTSPRELPAARNLARRAREEIWRFFPTWMFFFYGCLLLNTELTNLVPPRDDLAYTALFPLSVFALFYGVRAYRAPEVRRRSAMFFVAAALCLGWPLLNLAVHRPSPFELPLLRRMFELSNFVWGALLLVHALRRRPSHAVLFFGVGLLYGALLENGGILLGFYGEHHLTQTRVGPLLAPLATMLGWCVVLYMATFTVWELRSYLPWLKRSATASALLISIFSMMLDLQIDPAATATGCWVWNPTLPPFFHGVPLVNFVAWICALFPFAYVLMRYQQRANLEESSGFTPAQLLRLLYAVPVVLVLAALLFVGATLAIEGAEGPSWSLLNRFAVQLFAAI